MDDIHSQLAKKIEALLPADVEDKLQEFLRAINEDYQRADHALLGIKRGFEVSDQDLQKQCEELNAKLTETQREHHRLKQQLSLIRATLESSVYGVLVVVK